MPQDPNKAQLYYDTLWIHTLLDQERTLTKTAQSGVVSSIVDAVKNFVSSHIDPNDKVGSVLNMMAPGVLTMLGFPIIGALTEIATSWFGFNLGKIFEDIASEIKSLIMGGNKTTSSAVDSIVSQVVQGNAPADPTQSDLDKAQFAPLSFLSHSSLHQAKLYKLALQSYLQADLLKQAGLFSTLGSFVGFQRTTTNALVKIIGWIIKAMLASAGFIVADDAIHSLVGSPSKSNFSEPQSSSTPSSSSSNIAVHNSTQTTFKVNPEYQEERVNLTDRWIEPVAPSQIGNQIIQWTHEIYPDTQHLADNDIEDTSGFMTALKAIQDYNSTNQLNVTFMPKAFTSRKKVVDLFIDELANKTPSTTPSTPPAKSSPTLSDMM